MYKYTGDGVSYLPGVPMRDLSKEDFDALSKARQEAVKESALYGAKTSSNANDSSSRSSGKSQPPAEKAHEDPKHSEE